jgi:hypothetical protein
MFDGLDRLRPCINVMAHHHAMTDFVLPRNKLNVLASGTNLGRMRTHAEDISSNTNSGDDVFFDRRKT